MSTSSIVSHPTTIPSATDRPRHPETQGATLHPHHRHELEVGSGIPLDWIAARGCYSTNDGAHLRSLGFATSQTQPEMGPWLVFPLWNLAGLQCGFMVKPDHPRTVDGDVVKYESLPAGVPTTKIDCHPMARPLLRDPSRTKYVTEGVKKGDAAASRGLACAALPGGTYGFMRGRMVVDELDEVWLGGCEARVAFDSDVMTKDSVADARRRLAKALDRRGATVAMTTFDHLPNGDKCGFDDYFVHGGTPHGLDAITTRWRDDTPQEPLHTSAEDLRTKNEALRRALENERRNASRRDREVASLYRVIWDKALSPVTKAVTVCAIAMAHEKRAKHAVEPGGRIRLSMGEISRDFRTAAETGTAKTKANRDGSPFLTERRSAMPRLEEMAAAGLVDMEFVKVVRVGGPNGTYDDHDALVRIGDDIADDLERFSRHDIAKTERADYGTKPCASCGEVHDRTQRRYCNGCGHEYEPAKVIPARKPRNAAETDAPPDIQPRVEIKSQGTSAREPLRNTPNPPPPDLPPDIQSYLEIKSQGLSTKPSLRFNLNPPPAAPPNLARDALSGWLAGGSVPIDVLNTRAREARIIPDDLKSAREALGVVTYAIDGRRYARLPSRHEQGVAS